MIADLPQIIADLIKSQWSLELGDEPSVAYRRDAYMMNSRVGAIYVYMIAGTQNISTIDYRTTQRVANLSIRLAFRVRSAGFGVDCMGDEIGPEKP